MRYLKQNIKYLRNIQGLTQPQMGDLIGVSRDNIASYERGTTPPVEIVHRILNQFHVNFNDLLDKDLSKLDPPIASDQDREDIRRIKSSAEIESLKEEIISRNKSIDALEQIIEAQKNTIKSQQETIEALKMLVDRG